MLSKAHRITKQKDFEQIFKKGKKLKEDFLILAVLNNSLDETRFGFIVSRKVSKKATLRNKIKRRLRALIKPQISQIKKGLDIAIMACPGLEVKDFWEMESIINKLLKKSNCLKNKS